MSYQSLLFRLIVPGHIVAIERILASIKLCHTRFIHHLFHFLLTSRWVNEAVIVDMWRLFSNDPRAI